MEEDDDFGGRWRAAIPPTTAGNVVVIVGGEEAEEARPEVVKLEHAACHMPLSTPARRGPPPVIAAAWDGFSSK